MARCRYRSILLPFRVKYHLPYTAFSCRTTLIKSIGFTKYILYTILVKYHFSYKIDEDGIWGNCCEVPDLYAQGNSVDDFKKNCEEALNLMLEEPEDSQIEFNLPEKKYDKKKNTIQVPVYPEVAFGMMLRMYRLKHGMTQKQAAEKLGMKNVYSYQRLEKKSNPTLSMLKKVTEVFPDMQLEMLLN